jgi:hypothetical protein
MARPFELPDRALAELRIACKVVGVKDRMDIAQRVTSDSRDLSLAGTD